MGHFLAGVISRLCYCLKLNVQQYVHIGLASYISYPMVVECFSYLSICILDAYKFIAVLIKPLLNTAAIKPLPSLYQLYHFNAN